MTTTMSLFSNYPYGGSVFTHVCVLLRLSLSDIVWLPPPRKLCFHERYFVRLLVSRIMEKLLKRFHKTERWHTEHRRNGSLLMVIWITLC